MLLAIDVGNTETVLGVFRDDGELGPHWRIATWPGRTADELALLLAGFLEHQDIAFPGDLTGVALSSGVPALTKELRAMVSLYCGFDPVVVEPGVRTGIQVRTDNPREVGADRIVNALAAFTRFGGPCIVVDFGTATTYDAVSAKGEYLGGAIAPGLRIAADSLVAHAARLPDVELVAPPTVIGRNTVDAMQSGLVIGAVAELEGMITRIEEEMGEDCTVVATGGLAPSVIAATDTIDHHEPWLTLEGLRILFEKNSDD